MAPQSVARGKSIAAFTPELDQLAINAMADWKVPGAALAVVKHGKVALARTYGQRDVEANLPRDPFHAVPHRLDPEDVHGHRRRTPAERGAP
jgi:CubicO group peptidase (beta-lactamase class C family)